MATETPQRCWWDTYEPLRLLGGPQPCWLNMFPLCSYREIDSDALRIDRSTGQSARHCREKFGAHMMEAGTVLTTATGAGAMWFGGKVLVTAAVAEAWFRRFHEASANIPSPDEPPLPS